MRSLKTKTEFSSILKVIDPSDGEPLRVLVFENGVMNCEFVTELIDAQDDEGGVPWTMTVAGNGDVYEYLAGDFDERMERMKSNDK